MSSNAKARSRARSLAVLIGLCGIAVAGACLLAGHGLWPWLDAASPATKEGREGAPITTGYFFYLGRYIPPPYRVTVEGYRVLVNGEFPIITMSEPAKPSLTPVKDPGEFDWTPEKLKMPVRESGFFRHAGKRFTYWALKYDPERAWHMLIEYFKAQPTVKEVKDASFGYLQVVDISGKSCSFCAALGGPGGLRQHLKSKYASSDAEAEDTRKKAIAQVKQRLEEWRAAREESLRNGGAVFIISPGGGIQASIGGHCARDRLAEVRQLVQSHRPEEEKRAALAKILGESGLVDQLLANRAGPWPVLGPAPAH